MTLPNVSLGDPHVQAHNDERAQINALLEDHVSQSDLVGLASADQFYTKDDIGNVNPDLAAVYTTAKS